MGQFSGEAGSRHNERVRQTKDAEKILNLGKESGGFDMYASQEGGKYVLSIGQVHSDVMLKGTENAFEKLTEGGIQDLIDNQKHIEALLLNLKENYGVKEIYLEDTPSSWSLKKIDLLKNELGAIANPETKLSFIEAACAHFDDSMFDCEKGPLLYCLQHALQELATTDLNEAGRVRAATLQKNIASSPLVSGENVYLWGGALKLFVEGKMNAKIADADKEAAKEFASKNFFAETPGIQNDDENENLEQRLRSAKIMASKMADQKDFMRMFIANNNFREDAALDIIARDAVHSSQRFYPLVFGVAHDFSDNIKKYDESHGPGLGLINIYEKAR
ncbi:MAG: hypothetical protein Q7S28_01925, partial [bacterium]|nr:hypothetical protein [bacterium]